MKIIALPLAPLESLVRSKADLPVNSNGDPGGLFSDKLFADMIGVSSRAIARWRQANNTIPWTSADAAAITMGLHPLLIWGEDWVDMDRAVIDGSSRDMGRIETAMEAIGRVLIQESATLESHGPLSP